MDDDSKRLSIIEEQLNHILRGREDGEKVAQTSVSGVWTFICIDRKLHQMLCAYRNYESAGVITKLM